MEELDLLDRRIMYELDLDARMPASGLAKRLRRSKETVNFRLNRLLKDGYLNGFYTIFNTSKLGWYYHKMYMKFKNVTPKKEAEIFDYIRKQPHVAYLASVEGSYDCIFLVMVKGAKDIVKFLYPFMKLYGEYVQEKDSVIFLTTHRLNQRFLFPGKTRKNSFYPVELGTYAIDEIDRHLMELLSTNARMPLTEMAGRIGADPKVLKYRLKKLERDGIILSYVTSPNFDKLKLQFAQLNISLKDPTAKKSVIEYFDSTNTCLFAIEMLGKYDLTIELHVKNNEELKAIIDAFRNRFVSVYNDYDILTINKEYVMVWAPFSEK